MKDIYFAFILLLNPALGVNVASNVARGIKRTSGVASHDGTLQPGTRTRDKPTIAPHAGMVNQPMFRGMELSEKLERDRVAMQRNLKFLERIKVNFDDAGHEYNAEIIQLLQSFTSMPLKYFDFKEIHSVETLIRRLKSDITEKDIALSEALELEEAAEKQIDPKILELKTDILKLSEAEGFYKGKMNEIIDGPIAAYAIIKPDGSMASDETKISAMFLKPADAIETYRKLLEEATEKKAKLIAQFIELTAGTANGKFASLQAELEAEQQAKARLQSMYWNLFRKSGKAKTKRKQDLNKHRAVLKRLVAEQKKIQEEATASAQLARAKTAEVESLAKQVEGSKVQLETLEQSIKEAAASIEKAKREAENTGLDAEQSKSLLQKRVEEWRDLEAEKEDLLAKSSALKKEISNAQNQVERLESDIERKNVEIEASKNELTAATARFSEALQTTKIELEERRKNIAALQKQVEQTVSSNGKLEAGMAAIKQELQEAKQQTEAELQRVVEAQGVIEELTAKNKKLESTVLEQQAKLVEAEVMRAEIEREALESKAAIDSMKETVETSEQTNKVLEGQVKSFEETNKTLQAEAEKVVGLQASIESLNSDLKRRAEDYEAGLAEKEQQIRDVKESSDKSLAEKTEEITKLAGDMQALREAHKLKVEQLSEGMRKLKDELKEVKLQRHNLVLLKKTRKAEYREALLSSNLEIIKLEGQLRAQQESAEHEMDLAHKKFEVTMDLAINHAEAKMKELRSQTEAEKETMQKLHQLELEAEQTHTSHYKKEFEAAVEHLTGQIKSHQEENKRHAESLASAVSMIQDLLRLNGAAVKDLKTAGEQIDQLNQSLKESIASNELLRAAQEELQAKYDGLQEENQAAVQLQKETETKLAQWKALSSIADEPETAEADIIQQKITTMLSEKDSKISALDSDLRGRMEEREAVQSQLDALNEQYNSVRQAVEGDLVATVESANPLVQKIGQLRETLAGEIKAKEEKIAELQAATEKGEDTTRQVEALRGELTSLQETKTSLDLTVSGLQGKLAVEQEKHAKESAELREKLHGLDLSITDKSAQLENMRAEKVELERKNQATRDELTSVRREMESVGERKKRVEHELKLAQERHQKSDLLSKDLQSRLDSATSNIRQKEAELQRLMTSAKSMYHQHTSEAEKLRSDIGLRKQEIQGLQTELNTAKDRVSHQAEQIINLTQQTVSLQSQVRIHTERIAALENEASGQKGRIGELEKGIKERDLTINEQIREMAELRKQIQQQKEQLARQSEAHTELLNELQSRLNKALEDVASLKSTHAEIVGQLQKDIQSFEGELALKTKEIESRKAEQAKLGKELDKVKQVLGKKTSEIGAQKERIARLKATKKELRQALLDAKQKHKEKKQKMKTKLEAEAEAQRKLRERLREKKREVKILQAQKKELERDNSKAKLQKQLKKTAESVEKKSAASEVLAKFMRHLESYEGQTEEDLKELKAWYKQEIVTPKLVTPEIRQIWVTFKRSAREASKLRADAKKMEGETSSRVEQLEAENQKLREQLAAKDVPVARLEKAEEQPEDEPKANEERVGEEVEKARDTIGTAIQVLQESVESIEQANGDGEFDDSTFEVYQHHLETLRATIRLFQGHVKLDEPEEEMGRVLEGVGKAIVEMEQQMFQVKAAKIELEQEQSTGASTDVDASGTTGTLGVSGGQPTSDDTSGGVGEPTEPKESGEPPVDTGESVAQTGGSAQPGDSTAVDHLEKVIQMGGRLKSLQKLFEWIAKNRAFLETRRRTIEEEKASISPKPEPRQPFKPSGPFKIRPQMIHLQDEFGSDDDDDGGEMKLMIGLPPNDCDEKLAAERRKNLGLLEEVARLVRYINSTLKDLMNAQTGNNYVINQVTKTLQAGTPIINPTVSIPSVSDDEDDVPTVILQQCADVCMVESLDVLVNAGDSVRKGGSGSSFLAWSVAVLLGVTLVGACSWYWFVLRVPAAAI